MGCDVGEVKLHEGRRHGSRCGEDRSRDDGVEACLRVRYIDTEQLADDAEQPGKQNAIQHVALYALDQHHGNDHDTDKCEDNGDSLCGECAVCDGCVEAEQCDECGTVNDQAGVLNTDEGNEEADTDRYRYLQAGRDGIEDCLTNIGEGKKNKYKTFHKYCGQRNLPRVTHTDTYGICEVGVETETCRQCERLVGERCHTEAGNRGSDRCSCNDRTSVHSGSFQNARVDCKDVDHGHEGRNAGNDFCSYIGTVFLKLKILFKHLKCLPPSRLSYPLKNKYSCIPSPVRRSIRKKQKHHSPAVKAAG